MTFGSSLTPETMDHIQDTEYLRIKGASGLVQSNTHRKKLKTKMEKRDALDSNAYKTFMG